MKSFSLVLPCYNESKSLPALVERVLKSVRKRNLTPTQFRLVLIENGSRDNSRGVMEGIQKNPGGEFIDIVPVFPNQGYGYGLFQGLKKVTTDFVAYSHADEQCDPEDAFRGWEMIRECADKILVKGKRRGREFQDRLISRGFEIAATFILMRRLTEINAQPKVFRRELILSLTNPPFDFAFDIYVLMKAREEGYRFQEIVVDFPPRRHGTSNWASTFRSKSRTILKMLRYMMRYRFQGV